MQLSRVLNPSCHFMNLRNRSSVKKVTLITIYYVYIKYNNYYDQTKRHAALQTKSDFHISCFCRLRSHVFHTFPCLLFPQSISPPYPSGLPFNGKGLNVPCSKCWVSENLRTTQRKCCQVPGQYAVDGYAATVSGCQVLCATWIRITVSMALRAGWVRISDPVWRNWYQTFQSREDLIELKDAAKAVTCIKPNRPHLFTRLLGQSGLTVPHLINRSDPLPEHVRL